MEITWYVISLKFYHAEQKGAVEKCFDVIQDYYKLVLKGYGVVEEDFQERGAVDYRKQATLTFADFEKVIVLSAVLNTMRGILSFIWFGLIGIAMVKYGKGEMENC